jgi:hypothetical protein
LEVFKRRILFWSVVRFSFQGALPRLPVRLFSLDAEGGDDDDDQAFMLILVKRAENIRPFILLSGPF